MRAALACALALAALGCDPAPEETRDAAAALDGAIDASPEPADAFAPDAFAPDGDPVDLGLPDAAPAPDAASPVDERPLYVICDSAPDPALPREDWRHFGSGLVALGAPGHTAQDVIAFTGRPTQVPGKFAYGLISKDLEDEDIIVAVDDCAGGWRTLGRAATDSDGRIALRVEPGDLPPIGRHALWLHVVGDGTAARSTLTVVPEGTEAIVFDIDGTLTTDDMELFQDVFAELFEPILSGDYVPEARAGALELTAVRAWDQGYEIIYLTGRPYLLTDISREWLDALGFPPGTLHVVDDVAEILPTNEAVGAYKRDWLRALREAGLVIEAAYGNATTDIYAYGEAGIDPARTFIAGEHGGEAGTVAVGDDYLGHLPVAEAEPPAEQPFRR
ncbi:MAG: hypothetical protein R3F65_07620 [bacterium]